MASSSQGSHKLLYSLVARGTTVLAEYRSAGPALGHAQHIPAPNPHHLGHTVPCALAPAVPYLEMRQQSQCVFWSVYHLRIRKQHPVSCVYSSPRFHGMSAVLIGHGLFCCDGCCDAWKLSSCFLALKQPSKTVWGTSKYGHQQMQGAAAGVVCALPTPLPPCAHNTPQCTHVLCLCDNPVPYTAAQEQCGKTSDLTSYCMQHMTSCSSVVGVFV